MGLGLAITRKYVEVMGGSIAVDSTLNIGSRFRVELPVETAAPIPLDGLRAGVQSAERIPHSSAPCSVLVVDDDENNLHLLQHLLQTAGLRFYRASDGQAAIDSFREIRPEFIWMDWHMPGVNGLEATRRIRAMEGGQEVKIAALTASAFDEQRAEFMAAGLDDFVRKPYRPEQIFDCMARHLGMTFPAREGCVQGNAHKVRALELDAITSIPAAQRMQLADALLSLDVERVNTAIREISELDSSIAATLNELAQRFAYTELFRAMQPRESANRKATL
jgi:CheY-like chemotaxis protein